MNDYILIAIGWLVTIVLLILFIPKHRIREAFVAFSFKQLLTWLLGLIVAEFRWIEYPVRIFSYACKSSFSFEYFIYPSFCAIFNLHFPKNASRRWKIMYILCFSTSLTVIEVVVERYTQIITYVHWSWQVTWISLTITFSLSRLFFKWFYKGKGGV